MRRGARGRKYYYGWSLLFQRTDERSTKFHCKGMHFKGEFKTSKILSALSTELKGGVAELYSVPITITYYDFSTRKES